ncbi:hypothetical protein [Arthrobacter sp. efr-133-TYG-118]|uniref:hypothetical protein n=1 Tax=Arthrobacter sp. efr-133-TYG-118 TaxID=3040279 RepID=UPI00254B9498|nr:hypothetical protein [Arthrobacter sp. efr-133-TYG-118]
MSDDGVLISHRSARTGVRKIAVGGPSLSGYLAENLPPRDSVFKIHDAPAGPVLRFRVNAEGKMDAEYDPAKLTEAALALMAEVARIQGGSAS